jgi:hypothetical protein
MQTGTQNPYESTPTLNAGERIVIVQRTGAANRFLHLDTGRCVLTLSTAGKTRGHNASGAANAFCVAATDVANSPSPNFFAGGATNPVRITSSDGPRQMFFSPTGVAITPGNFSSSGGTVLNKPDITAATGVATSVPGFSPFFGTSAAAPHAAAIAALIKSINPALTPAQVRSVMISTALDIEAAGFDRDSGWGIVMADPGLDVNPASPFVASGVSGGPFSPAAKTYTLTNDRSSNLDWTASASETWITLSATSGSLAPGATTTVTASINANANLLATGSYPATITFGRTLPDMTIERPVTLAVGGPEIAIEDAAGNNLISGNATVDFGRVPYQEVFGTGGIAVSKTFTIKNTGQGSLRGFSFAIDNPGAFTVTASPIGLDANDAEVYLPGPHGSTTFTVRFIPWTPSNPGGTTTLRITSNDSDESPFVINLTGSSYYWEQHVGRMSEQIPAAEYQALVDLYNFNGGTGWRHKFRWLDPSSPAWEGVYLSGVVLDPNGNVTQRGHVSELRLNGNQLIGQLPDSVGNLSTLQFLHLYSNHLSGQIPDSLSNLSVLQHLHLTDNELSGPLPSSLGTLGALQTLYLQSNQLTGVIPAALGNMSALQRLNISNKQLSGPIPSSLGNLGKLHFLYLSSNQLSGPIPDSLGNLNSLQRMDLGNNQLSGTIPNSFSNLSFLGDLRLYSNQLSGSIPSFLGNLSTLQDLYLYFNRFSGPIPDSLGNLNAVPLLFGNRLSGRVPGSLRNRNPILRTNFITLDSQQRAEFTS